MSNRNRKKLWTRILKWSIVGEAADVTLPTDFAIDAKLLLRLRKTMRMTLMLINRRALIKWPAITTIQKWKLMMLSAPTVVVSIEEICSVITRYRIAVRCVKSRPSSAS